MDKLPENDFPMKLRLALLSIIEKERFINYEIDIRRISSETGNFLGILYEIEVSGTTKGGEKELNLFVKLITNNTIDFLVLPNLYAAELFAYKELFKIFAELEEQANIPLEERYPTIKIYEESYEDAIIMEDITKKGFNANHRMNIQSLIFFEKAVKELAKFHALSFVLKETNPEYFTEKIKPLKHSITFNEHYKNFVSSLRDASIKHVDDEFKHILVKVFDDLPYKYAQYCHDETIAVCLRHGDYKFSNLMATTDIDENQKIMPIDYQLIHYGNPVFDFLFLIFSGTTREFRKAHLLNLKKLYLETLDTHLKYFNLDIDTVYPREDFEKVYKEKLDFGLLSTAWCLPLMFSAGDAAPDIIEGERIKLQCDNEIKSRLQGLLEDFIEWGYI